MRGVRSAVVAALALIALVGSLAAMHAAMGSGTQQQAHEHTSTMQLHPDEATISIDATAQPAMPDGGMSPMNCLVLGMACFLMAVAVLLRTVVVVRLRSLLRSRALQLLVEARGRLQPPRPPSLLVLSISRV